MNTIQAIRSFQLNKLSLPHLALMLAILVGVLLLRPAHAQVSHYSPTWS